MFLLTYALGTLFTYFFIHDDYNDPRWLALQNEGEGMFEGDMIVNVHEMMLRNGIADTKYRWPGYPGAGNVPYVIDSSVASHSKLILQAMEQYNKLTCIKFAPRKSEKDYIKIFKGTGCYSVVGRNQSVPQPQPLSLGDGCYNIGTIVHELGHAIGIFHEHSRSDRDTYLDIFINNVAVNQRHNFKKLLPSENLLLTPFNYNSIMIYGNKAFSVNGQNTMVAKNGTPLTNPYSKPGMDNTDIDRVKKLYKCK